MEQVDQLHQVDSQHREDLYLKDFVNKRNMLLTETMRSMANLCMSKCQEHAKATDSTDFSLLEQQCLAKCEAKVAKVQKLVERHVDDTFNPDFVHKYI